MKHFVKYDMVPLLSMLAVCAFPCVFLYAQNADEVPASSMAPFLIVFIINSLLIFGILSVFLRNMSRSAFLTDLSMLVVINFCLLSTQLKKIMPFLRDRYLLAVLLLILLGLFVLFLRKKPDLRTGCLLMLIAFGSMIFMNLVFAVPTILQGQEKVREPRDQSGYEDRGGKAGGGRGGKGLKGAGGPEKAPPGGQQAYVRFSAEKKPNVYYFLFDEYGGYENLLYYYDFDNSEFLEALEDRGFSVARESRNTEAVATDTIMSNLLNLDYVVKVEESGRKKADYRRRPYLYQLFRDNGYQVNLINHVDYLGAEGCRVLTSHQTRRTISEYLMRNSIYNKSRYLRNLLDQFFVVDYGANYRRSLDNATDAGLHCWEAAQNGPTLTVGYIQCPHSPTMVGPHGEELSYAQGWNWRDHSLYLGQVQYISAYILELVDILQEKDPEALILLQSDHGNRYAIHMVQLGEQADYDPYVENPYMQNILNCVYFQGRSFSIEEETGINTLRLVFREVLGADLPPVEPCQDYSTGYTDEQE